MHSTSKTIYLTQLAFLSSPWTNHIHTFDVEYTCTVSRNKVASCSYNNYNSNKPYYNYGLNNQTSKKLAGYLLQSDPPYNDIVVASIRASGVFGGHYALFRSLLRL